MVKSYKKWNLRDKKIENNKKEPFKFTRNKCNNKFNKFNNNCNHSKERLRKESILGANHHKRRKLQRFLIFMVDVIPKSTLIGKLKWNKFSMKII